nr:MAG TPA: hypothetical protein [Caudoviricetes sp.]
MVVKCFYNIFNIFSNLRLRVITTKVITLSLFIFARKCYN